MVQMIITRGKAVISPDGLRCSSPRVADSSKNRAQQVCNRLLVKANQFGQIAGNFLCDRCKQTVEIQIVS
jgi:hypothetical protein